MIGFSDKLKVVVWGAGEMASGVIHKLHNCGYSVIALETTEPCCVRRMVCFAEAVYEGEITVEGIKGRLARDFNEAEMLLENNIIPVLVDSEAHILNYLKCHILVDGRMLKSGIDVSKDIADLVIGLGPGFVPGTNCHMAIETNRGDNLGRVLTDSVPQEDTGIPASVEGFTTERVLRAPGDGIIIGEFEIGDFVKEGDIVAEVAGVPVGCEIGGVLRGICRNGLWVDKNQKIGDIDPRGRRELCYRISDKASIIAEGVLKAITEFERSRIEV